MITSFFIFLDFNSIRMPMPKVTLPLQTLEIPILLSNHLLNLFHVPFSEFIVIRAKLIRFHLLLLFLHIVFVIFNAFLIDSKFR